MNRIITTSFLALALAACGSGNDDAAPAGEPADGGLGDALDGVLQDLPEPLGAALPEPLASLAAANGHLR